MLPFLPPLPKFLPAGCPFAKALAFDLTSTSHSDYASHSVAGMHNCDTFCELCQLLAAHAEHMTFHTNRRNFNVDCSVRIQHVSSFIREGRARKRILLSGIWLRRRVFSD